MSDQKSSSIPLLKQAESLLAQSDAPHLDSRWLLAHVLKLDHRDPSLRSELWLTKNQMEQFHALLERRSEGEPLAYILQEWEFYGHSLEITPAVLVPRAETELLVDWALELLASISSPRVAEIGVGSGAVSVALAKERPDLSLVGVEISIEALEVAERNIKRHQVAERIDLRAGSHFDPLDGKFQLIVANPPYIAPEDPLLQESVARHEPTIALIDRLDGDGLGHHRVLIESFCRWVSPGGALLLECGFEQADSIEQFARERGLGSDSRADLAGIPRAVLVQAKA